MENRGGPTRVRRYPFVMLKMIQKSVNAGNKKMSFPKISSFTDNKPPQALDMFFKRVSDTGVDSDAKSDTGTDSDAKSDLGSHGVDFDNLEYTQNVINTYGYKSTRYEWNVKARPEIDSSKLVFNPTLKNGIYSWTGSDAVELAMAIMDHNIINRTKCTFSEDTMIPCRNKVTDSGFDLELARLLKSENGIDYYTTGVSISPPAGYWYMLVPRSSMAKSGYVLANGIGIIDMSYRGEIIVALRKVNENAKPIELPARMVQIIPMKWYPMMFNVVESLDQTDRGSSGGLGSAQFSR